MASRAYSHYLAGEFQAAVRDYGALLSLAPDNPGYHYYYGVAVLESANDRKKAIGHLEQAVKGGVPSMVHFHLANAYRQEYRFEKAISHYELVLQKQNKVFIREKKVHQLVDMCRRAANAEFKNDYVSILSHSEKSLNAFNSDSYFNEGRFLAMPDRIAGKHNRDQFGTHLYIDSTEQWMVYSGPGRKGASEIFVKARKSYSTWDKPKQIRFSSELAMDKYFPTITPDGRTVFFSSDGYNSLGGLDVFKCVYNPETGNWSIPERLPYPVNSPSDDYYYLPLEGGNGMVFCSNRQSASGEIGVYAATRLSTDGLPLMEGATQGSPARGFSLPVEAAPRPSGTDTLPGQGSKDVPGEVVPAVPVSAAVEKDNTEPAIQPQETENNVPDAGRMPDPADIPVKSANDDPGSPSIENELPDDQNGENHHGPVALHGFFYSADEPSASAAQILAIPLDGGDIVSAITDPSTGSYRLAVPAAGDYRVTVIKPGRAGMHGEISLGDTGAEVCVQVLTYRDASDVRRLSLVSCASAISEGTRYAVQLGAFRQRTAAELEAAFGNMGIEGTCFRKENGYLVFLAGTPADFYTALKHRAGLIGQGHGDAFIVAIQDGDVLPLTPFLAAGD